MNRFTVSLITLAASQSLVGTALAQTDPTAPATDAKGDDVIVTATRSGDPIPRDLLGASVTTLDAAALEQRQTRVVSDILRDVPGVAVSRTGAVGGFTQVRIRGAEANQTLVLIDGIKLADPYYSEYDFGTLIADEDARIEVLRGQQSALYGSDAIGGVVNYLTLTGKEAPGIKLRAEGGSQGTASVGARAAGVADTIDYALSTSFSHTDGYPTAIGGRRDIGSDSLGASAKVTWTPTATFKLTGVFRYSRTAADANDTNNVFGSAGYGLTIDSPGVRYVNDGYYGLLRGQLDLFDGRFTNTVIGQIADTTRTGYDVANPYAAPAGQPIVAAYGDHGQRLKGSYEGTFHFDGDGDGAKQSLTAAVDVERERARATISQYGAFLGNNTTTNTGLIGEYELVLDDRLGFGASIRHDFNTRFADDTTFRAQASYLFPSGTRLHAAGGSGVKNPTLSQLFDYYAGRYVGNPNLKPVVSIGWEAGVGQQSGDGRIALDATFFSNRLKNEITTVYDASFVGHPVNLAGSRPQRGVELSAQAKFGDGWRVDAGYTYLDAPQDRQVTFPATLKTGNFSGEAVRRAQHIASANLTWAPERLPFSGTVTVRYNGPQYDLFYGSFPPLLVDLHPYALINLNAAYRVTKKVELFGRVENLLDHDYVEIYGVATSPRAAYGGIRVRL